MENKMTFEEWWAKQMANFDPSETIDLMQLAMVAWNAATLAEREACAKVCDEFAGPFNSHRLGEVADRIRMRSK